MHSADAGTVRRRLVLVRRSKLYCDDEQRIRLVEVERYIAARFRDGSISVYCGSCVKLSYLPTLGAFVLFIII